MTNQEALDILNDPFLWNDLAEGYDNQDLAEALRIAVYALAAKVAEEAR